MNLRIIIFLTILSAQAAWGLDFFDFIQNKVQCLTHCIDDFWA